MTRILAALCLLLGLTVSASASQDLRMSWVLFANFRCSSGDHTAEFVNSTAAPMHVRQLVTWIGVDGGGVADLFIEVKRHSDGAAFVWTNWDHYKDPDNFHNYVENFEPDYVLLAAGDKLDIHYYCIPWGGTNPMVSYLVRAYWTAAP